ncbi:MAG: FHA domain-containing protein [Planctomycetota bacterium]
MIIEVEILQGPAAGQKFSFPSDEKFIVGRGDTAGFQIEEDELLSREHFSLEFDGDQLLLTDLGSTNGTFVNGHALTHRPLVLKDGQQFVAGRVSCFLVRYSNEAQSKAEKKTTPSIAPPPSPVQPGTFPTTPTGNFGSSIYSEGQSELDAMPGPSGAPDQAGGNFSQSIVTGYGVPRRPQIQARDLGNAGPIGTPQSGLPTQQAGSSNDRSKSFDPAPMSQLPPRPEGHPAEAPLVEDYGSIAPPGGQGAAVTQFQPLGGDPKTPPNKPPLTAVPPDDDSQFLPLPSASVEPGPEATPEQSPFSSIQTPTPQPMTEIPVTPAEIKTNPVNRSPGGEDLSSGGMPPYSIQQGSLGSGSQVTGSISAPGQMGVAPVPTHSDPSSTQESNFASIGMPDQIHQPAPPRSPNNANVEQALAPGQIAIWPRQQLNGIYFFGGKEIGDLERVRQFLVSKFDSIYCVNLAQLGIVEQKSDQEVAKDQSTSLAKEPEENSSPFGNFEDPVEGGQANKNQDQGQSDSPFEETPADEAKPDKVAAKKPEEPKTMRIGEPLFDWYPEEIRWENPVLLTEDEFNLPIDEVWNQDSVVCLYGSSAKQISEHCRELIRTNIRTGRSGSMFGFCWPNVLDNALESMAPKFVARIFQGGVAAILLEDPQQEFAWNIISQSDLSNLLVESGFVLQAYQ